MWPLSINLFTRDKTSSTESEIDFPSAMQISKYVQPLLHPSWILIEDLEYFDHVTVSDGFGTTQIVSNYSNPDYENTRSFTSTQNNTTRSYSFNFKFLEKFHKKVSKGIVIDTRKDIVSINESNYQIPVFMIGI